MKLPFRKLLGELNKPPENESAIDELTGHVVQELRRDKNFVRRLREVAFVAAQRKCEAAVWETLFDAACLRLNAQAAREAKAAARAALPFREVTDWSQAELARAMGGIDQGLISNALALVVAKRADKIASLSLPSLISILTSLEIHWKDLGCLPPFQELRVQWRIAAIGYAQHYVCQKYRMPPPPIPQPSLDDFTQLQSHFAAWPAAMETSPAAHASWTTWGVGWLISRAILGGKHSAESSP